MTPTPNRTTALVLSCVTPSPLRYRINRVSCSRPSINLASGQGLRSLNDTSSQFGTPSGTDGLDHRTSRDYDTHILRARTPSRSTRRDEISSECLNESQLRCHACRQWYSYTINDTSPHHCAQMDSFRPTTPHFVNDDDEDMCANGDPLGYPCKELSITPKHDAIHLQKTDLIPPSTRFSGNKSGEDDPFVEPPQVGRNHCDVPDSDVLDGVKWTYLDEAIFLLAHGYSSVVSPHAEGRC